MHEWDGNEKRQRWRDGTGGNWTLEGCFVSYGVHTGTDGLYRALRTFLTVPQSDCIVN